MHYVATVYIAPNRVAFMDSLKPRGKPSDAVLLQMKLSYNLSPGSLIVDSFIVQQQTGVDCGSFSIANMWCFLRGLDLRKILFNEETIRNELYNSFKRRKLFFRTKTCKQRHVSKSYRFKIK